MPTKEKKAKKFFVPEVIQTSEMDCGPASLKALLEGFGISTSYGRLREACQTTVDGTSIDSIEDLAVKLGLIAKQIMLPYDHVLLQNYWALPSLVVTRTPGGLTHFVVAWSQHGRWIQVMDPGIGRRWVSREQFIEDMFKHTFPVLASSWRGWAGSPDFLEPLRKRMSLMCVPEELITQMETLALQDAGWRGLGTLDASVRLVDSLVQSRAVEPGSQAGALIQQLFQSYLSLTEDGSDQEQPPAPEFLIPSSYWSVTPLSSSQKTEGEWLNLYGAVMIRIHGLRKESEGGLQPGEPQTLSPELEAILAEPPRKIEKLLQEMLRQDGWLAPSILAAAFCISAAGVALQAFLLQGILSIQKIFPVLNERLYALAALFVFLIALFLIEIPLDTAVHYMGNRLEIRLRTAFLLKIPSLSDRYFHSRLTSDMTWRARGLRSLRRLPLLAVQFLTTAFRLLITAAGVVWLQPQSFGFSLAALVIFAAFGYLSHSVVQETDLRQRTHAGALSRYYLDALQGLLPLRTHGAERPFRREHEGLMVEWMRANTSSARIGLFIQGLSAILYTAFAAWVGLDYARSSAQIGGGLLLFYWVLNLPIYCQALILLFQQYPQQRNSLLSVLEPLDAREESHSSQENPPEIPSISLESAGGVRIEMQQVDIIAGGHPILEGVNLSIASGEHLAIVGPSGAGKSTLVGILLGWHTPANGTCLVDGYRLGGQALFDLRRRTVWVDPEVQIWNRTLLENLTYGNDPAEVGKQGLVFEDADLFALFERLEDGLQTTLGEGGGLVSGGEGQRVRLARAMNRDHVRLVILDEPFRGLDRTQRRRLLAKARQFWQGATLICITHDISETMDFKRVMVIENGQLLEDENAKTLMDNPASRYSQLLHAEQMVRDNLWEADKWRRLWIEDGKLSEKTF